MKFFAASFMRPVLSALCGLLVLTSAAEGAEMTEQNTEQSPNKKQNDKTKNSQKDCNFNLF